jgi:hypothetical protein
MVSTRKSSPVPSIPRFSSLTKLRHLENRDTGLSSLTACG